MKISIPKLIVLVVRTIATSCAGHEIVVQDENSLFVNEEPIAFTDGIAVLSSSSSFFSAGTSVSQKLSDGPPTVPRRRNLVVEVSSADGDDVSAQRKLIKSSKKVKHPEALCTLSLFADSLFMYANQ